MSLLRLKTIPSMEEARVRNDREQGAIGSTHVDVWFFVSASEQREWRKFLWG
jgi:hypothetical protein